MQLSMTGFAWKNLWRRRLRTLLTLFGIIMGIGAFVTLVGFSRAFEDAWLSFYRSTGTDISVVGANFINSSLDEALADRIRALPDVAQVAPLAFNLVDLTPDVSALVYGWRANSYEFDSLTLLSGRRFRAGQNEVLLGLLLADALKKKTGDTLFIEGTTFTVVGVFRGGSALEDGAAVMSIGLLESLSNEDGKVFAFHIRLRPTPAGELRDVYLKRAAAEIEAAVPRVRAEPAFEDGFLLIAGRV